MKKLALTLLLINITTVFYLTIGARRELPPWRTTFEKAKEAMNQFQPMSPKEEVMAEVFKTHINFAEAHSTLVIEECERPELPLAGLTFLNIAGFLILTLKLKAAPKLV